MKKKSNKSFYKLTLEDLVSHFADIEAFTNGSDYKKLFEFIETKFDITQQLAAISCK